MEEIKKYIYAFDLSLNSTGLTIFNADAVPVLVTSIDTKHQKNHGKKLKVIADKLLELKELFVPETIIVENCFSRFNASTQALYKVRGLIEYLFSEYDQNFISYPPSSVKKTICGKGNATKEEVYYAVKKRFENIEFSNADESDACSVGLCYFIKEKGLKI